MRQSAPVFDTAQQQRVAIVEANGCRVEDAVDRVGPVFAVEDRICGVTGEERNFGVRFRLACCPWRALRF
jgi:hypothetical protein